MHLKVPQGDQAGLNKDLTWAICYLPLPYEPGDTRKSNSSNVKKQSQEQNQFGDN